MEIIIVRHGIAEDTAPGGDCERMLTDEGREKMRQVAEGIRNLKPNVEIVLTSPLVRAAQTAEIIAEALGVPVETAPELAPSGTPMDVCRMVAARTEAGGVILVGHQPNCGELASYLLTGRGGVPIEFKKGGACMIDVRRPAPSAGVLVWHMPPKVMRSVG